MMFLKELIDPRIERKEISMPVLHAGTASTTKTLQREIAGQMKDLPLEGLLTLRDFTAFLRQRSLTEPPSTSAPLSLHHLTVEMPAESLLGLMGLLPPIGGDALADTEALYDQV
jgi:hypothetical protein